MSEPTNIPPVDFCWAGTAQVPVGSSFGPYDTAHWEFIWGIEGVHHVKSGDRQFELRPGDVQLTPPGIRNHYTWDEFQGGAYGFVIFTMVEVLEWPRWREQRFNDIVVPLLEHVQWLDTVARTDPHWPTEALRVALAAYTSNHSATSAVQRASLPETIHRVLDYLARRWEGGEMRQPALAELAAAVHVTPEHLSRLFTHEFGVSLAAAMRSLRIGRSAELLTHTNMSVRDIAVRTGFSTEFYFSRAFSSATGLTPTQFRRKPDVRFDYPAPVQAIRLHLHAAR